MRSHARHILTIPLKGHTLVGTHHSPPSASRHDSIGVLLINAGPAPRAGNSDLSVHIADKLAAVGYHALRFDLPGLGDSTGESPSHIESYWHTVINGRNDEATAALVATLLDKLQLKGLIVGGLCAGAVTALRLAQARNSGVVGLLLLEPNFRVHLDIASPRLAAPNGVKPGKTPPVPITSPTRLQRRVHRVLDFVGFKQYPPGSNVPLIEGFRASLHREVPAIAILAKGQASNTFLRSIVGTLSRPARDSITTILIDDTNHILTSGDARAKSVAAVATWIARTFPISRVAA